jgi:hypothetical protein
MSYTERFSEVHSLLLTLHPVSRGIATTDSAYVSLANYHRAVLCINVGVMAGGSSLDIQIRQATNTAGAGVKGIPTTAAQSKLITQLTQAGGDGSQNLIIELRTEELDIANGFDCIAVRDTVAGGAVLLSYELYGIEPRFAPVGTTAWQEVVD